MTFNSGTGDKLLADVVQRNTDDLAATNEKLIQFEKDRAIRLAKALIKLWDAVEEVQVIDRDLLKVHIQLAYDRDEAEDLLDEVNG